MRSPRGRIVKLGIDVVVAIAIAIAICDCRCSLPARLDPHPPYIPEPQIVASRACLRAASPTSFPPHAKGGIVKVSLRGVTPSTNDWTDRQRLSRLWGAVDLGIDFEQPALGRELEHPVVAVVLHRPSSDCLLCALYCTRRCLPTPLLLVVFEQVSRDRLTSELRELYALAPRPLLRSLISAWLEPPRGSGNVLVCQHFHILVDQPCHSRLLLLQ